MNEISWNGRRRKKGWNGWSEPTLDPGWEATRIYQGGTISNNNSFDKVGIRDPWTVGVPVVGLSRGISTGIFDEFYAGRDIWTSALF